MPISAALIWMVIAIVALVIEATNLNLIFLFGGVAALLAGTLAALGVPPIGQILGFAVAALLIPARSDSDRLLHPWLSSALRPLA